MCRQIPPILLLAFLIASTASARVVLNLYEARILVEHTPNFLEAVERGECPQTSDSAATGDVATVIVRGGCKRYDLIAGFEVDLKTGFVRAATGSTKIETPQLGELRQKLFALRAQTEIPASEVLCLLKRIPVPKISDSCRSVKLIKENDTSSVATIEDSCSNAERSVATAIVDRYTGEIGDERTGQRYESQELDSLRSAISRLRSPATLSTDEARHLVEAHPIIADLTRKGWAKDEKCVEVIVDPFGNADEVWFQMRRGCGESKDVTRLSVNVLDATIRVIGPNAALDSADVQVLRARELADARSRKASAAQIVLSKCR